MKPEEIIELAKKAKLVVTLSSYDSVHSFAALHRQALIDSGELMPKEQAETDAERFAWWFSEDRSSNKEISDLLLRQLDGEKPDLKAWRTVIDRARGQPSDTERLNWMEKNVSAIRDIGWINGPLREAIDRARSQP